MNIIMGNRKIAQTTYHGRKQLISVASGFWESEVRSISCGQAGVVCLVSWSGYRQAGKISIDVCLFEPVKLFI